MGGLLSGKRVTLWVAVAVWIGVGVLPLFVMLATSLSSTENYTATLGERSDLGPFAQQLSCWQR